MELSSYKIKKFPIFQEIERSFLHFLKRKLFLHFKKGNFFTYRKTETPKIFCLIFQETELSNISFKKVFLTRSRGMFRTLSNIYDRTFFKSGHLAIFFLKISHSKNLSYVLGNGIFLYFSKWNFLALYFRK